MEQPTVTTPQPVGPRRLNRPGALTDEEKRRALVRMKAIALAFLVGAAVLFLGATWAEHAGLGAWAGYVAAAAEAGMVGGLADWFAVTALFRYPMGIKIPHTAIIPTRKDQLGDSLGDFVGQNFLAPDVVRDKLDRAGIARTIGDKLAVRDNAERITAEGAVALKGAVTVLRDDDVQAVVENAVMRKLVDLKWGPPLGKILDQVVADAAHHRLVDLLVDRSYEWVRDNHVTVLRVVSDRSPSWSPKFVDEMLADKVYGEVLAFAWAVKADQGHPMRLEIDRFLTKFAHDLQYDEQTVARAEQVKQRLIVHPEVQNVIASAWTTAKDMVLAAAEDPSSELRTRATDGIVRFGKRLQTEPELAAKVDKWFEDAAVHIVENYSAELTSLISDTIERWDGEETARKVELQVGKDLQFIRINGTVVGAMAGLIIYTIAQLLF